MPCHQGKHLVNIIIIPQQNYSLYSPFLQRLLILFLGAAALAAPLRPEKIAAELPNSIQNSFRCHNHKLIISSDLSGLHQFSYSAFKTANASSISSKLTVPPHMRWTYSGVMPARSIEQERISFSINCRRRVTNSSFNLLLFIISSMHIRLYNRPVLIFFSIQAKPEALLYSP